VTEAVAPELLFMETKWASLVPYGLTARALKGFLPVDATLNATTVQNHTLKVAQRYEGEPGGEQWAFVECCPADWETLPIPDGPITVGIVGGYVRDRNEKKSHFEVIMGTSILAFRREDEDITSSKGFGFVQTLDTKPKRCLFEVVSGSAAGRGAPRGLTPSLLMVSFQILIDTIDTLQIPPEDMHECHLPGSFTRSVPVARLGSSAPRNRGCG
jgi:hypothetical protein